jgi:hypothetical protein
MTYRVSKPALGHILVALVALVQFLTVDGKHIETVVVDRVEDGFGGLRHGRKLTDLEGFGGTPSQEHFPLQKCQGDCDEDSDVSGHRTMKKRPFKSLH